MRDENRSWLLLRQTRAVQAATNEIVLPRRALVIVLGIAGCPEPAGSDYESVVSEESRRFVLGPTHPTECIPIRLDVGSPQTTTLRTSELIFVTSISNPSNSVVDLAVLRDESPLLETRLRGDDGESSSFSSAVLERTAPLQAEIRAEFAIVSPGEAEVFLAGVLYGWESDVDLDVELHILDGGCAPK